MEEKNVQRVDKGPAAVFSVVVFVIIFFIVYMFYPQISMIIPFTGETVTMNTSYQSTPLETQIKQADSIVVVSIESESKTRSGQNNGTAYVCKTVDFKVEQTIKGEEKEELSLVVYGGSALFKDGTNRAKKYNVNYKNEAEFSKNKTYMLLLDANGKLLEGKFSVLYREKNGVFRDHSAGIYTIENIKSMMDEQ